jgi:SnoaL-like domain
MPLTAADRIAIIEVIGRYCHATDDGDGKGVAICFDENGILEIVGAWQARGREQVAEIGAIPNKAKHWVNNIVVDGTGSTATARTYFVAIRNNQILGTGIYDSWLTKRLNGQWKFVHHRYTGDPAVPLRPPEIN